MRIFSCLGRNELNIKYKASELRLSIQFNSILSFYVSRIEERHAVKFVNNDVQYNCSTKY